MKKKPETQVNWDDVISPGPIPELMSYKHKLEFFEAAQQADPTDYSIDCIDPYINGYFSLRNVQMCRPLTEEEQERFERCAQVLQKRRELWEFDRWLEEAFGIKIDSVPPSSDLFDD